MRFLVNAARKRTGKMASVRRRGKPASRTVWKASGFSRNTPKRRRKLAGAALAAHLKKKRSRSSTGTSRRAKRATTGGSSMAKRRRRRATAVTRRRRRRVASNPRRRRRRAQRNPRVRSRSHRRRFRRNPAISGRGLAKVAIQGVKDAALILVGKASTRAISAMVPFGSNVGIVGSLKQVGVALAVGFAAHKALGADAARMVVAGGIVAPLETLVKGLNIPMISANLGDATGAGASMFAANTEGNADTLHAYPLSGMGAYVTPGGDSGYGSY